MHDRRDDRHDRGRSRHDHGRGDGHRRDDRRNERRGHDHGSRDHGDGGDRPGGGPGGGPDTRFLQLEMSELLYAEAESVTRQAFRELLLEESRTHLRERFGDQIKGLAQLAVDEALEDVFASLDIEGRIRERHREHEGRRDRLSGILDAGGDGDEHHHDACGHDEGGCSEEGSDEER